MSRLIIKLFVLFIFAAGFAFNLQAKELANVNVADQLTMSNGEKLVLNGMGLREKLWIDVYVGSLYLGKKANNVAEVLSQPGALRIQMNFIYKEVASKKLIKAWKEGFEKNQTEDKIRDLQQRMDRFYSFFEENAVKDDLYVINYIPGEGSSVSKNNTLLGTIEGEDFKNALVEIWLGNTPADKGLKKGMLGLE